MSKLTKLMKNPSIFFLDSFQKRKHQLSDILNVSESVHHKPNKLTNNLPPKKSVPSVAKKSVPSVAKKSVPSVAKKGAPIVAKNKPLSELVSIAPEYSFEDNIESYIYLPWMRTHGDALIQSVNNSKNFKIYPLKIVNEYSDDNRRKISRLSRENPSEYRRILLSHLAVIKKDIQGVVLTFDWHPAMRILADACNDLGIKTILILHESVFLSEEKYYMYEWGGYEVNLPKCDHVITWGQLQKNIFIERGLDEHKIEVLGAPKFDIYHEYENLISRDNFCMIYGLNPKKKIFLYALQPMDVQVDQRIALREQNQALLDIIEYCEENDSQLIMREPPSNIKNTIFQKIRDKVDTDERFIIDRSGAYLLPVAENLHHVDLVLSVNSTLMLESLLSDTPVVSTKYFDFIQIWDGMNIPVAHNKSELFNQIDWVFATETPLKNINWCWAADNLSVGKFDGQSSTRITNYLEGLTSDKHLGSGENIVPFSSHIKYLANSNPNLVNSTGMYLPQLLNFSEMVKPKNEIEASLCDMAIQWGITDNNNKAAVSKLMKVFGKKPFIIEDGFIRSVGIGLSNEPALSITLCGDTTAYYDSYNVSSFEEILNSNRVFTDSELYHSKKAINLIVENHISKYNDSPYLPVSIGRDNVQKVLVIDQRYGDESVVRAKADENDFQKMLIDAITDNPNADIIIKRHPDAVKGGKGSYFIDSRIEFTRNVKNVFLIDYDIHPHQLLELVDKVYVCSSGLGFEALLYGKEVICYGVPFYSNWGVTTDRKIESRRQKQRTVEEIFYVSYIECSRYYSPELERVCNIEDCIKYIVDHRRI